MNSRVIFSLLITFIIFNESIASRKRKSKDLTKPFSPVMCYDQNRRPIFGDPQVSGYDPNCVYTSEAFETLMALPPDVLNSLEVNPECQKTDLCIAACEKSKCLSLGSVSGLFSYKAKWTLRFVCFGSIYTGCMLAFMIILYYSYRNRIRLIKYKTFLDQPVDDSDSGIDSALEEESREHMKPSYSFDESLYSESRMRSQKSYGSEKIIVAQKRKSNI